MCAWGQGARYLPVEGLLGRRQTRGESRGGRHAVRAWACAEHETDCDAVGRVCLGIPGHGEVFALGDGI